MPKSNLIRIDDTGNIIRSFAKRRGVRLDDVCTEADIPRATFFRHMRNPEDIRLGELRGMVRALELDDREILEVVRNGRD